MSDKASFLNDLAAKMAAGPPSKPVGLVKKPAQGAEGEQALPSAAPSEAQKKLGDLMKATVPAPVDDKDAADDK